VRSYPSPLCSDIFVLVPEGRLDALGSQPLGEELTRLHSEGHSQFVLNLSHATYISSSALRIILIHTRQLRQAHGDLRLCCLSDKVARVLQIAGFDAILDIFPDEGLAIEAFLRAQQGRKTNN
jgi:anti-anti-sigma factor